MAEHKRSGKLIVIDGTDGSGKKTQTKLLLDRLLEMKLPAISISFPQYGKKSAGAVEEYLNGRYGKPDGVSPYAASLFYAIDRYDLSSEIRARLNEGKIIITDRYVDANAGHQGGKIKNPEERKKFLTWLYETEYELLRIPKPDIVVLLHVPAELGMKLALQKQQRLYIEQGKRLDGHEEDIEHLKAAEASYLWLAEQFPKDHRVIECIDGEGLMPLEKIHGMIWKIVSPVL